jgi:hypothetical protein
MKSTKAIEIVWLEEGWKKERCIALSAQTPVAPQEITRHQNEKRPPEYDC